MAFMIPILTSMGASAATAATISSVATYAGMAATVIGGISQAQAAKDAAADGLKVAKYNAQSSINNAQTQKNLMDAKANEEEALGQIAALQKRREMGLKLSRAYAVSAAQGGGELPENLVGDLVERGETSAQYELYTGNTKGSNLRWQGDQNLATTTATANNSVATAKARKNQADSAFLPSVLGSVVKGLSMSSMLPGPAPGAFAAGEIGSGLSTFQGVSPLSDSLSIPSLSSMGVGGGASSFYQPLY